MASRNKEADDGDDDRSSAPPRVSKEEANEKQKAHVKKTSASDDEMKAIKQRNKLSQTTMINKRISESQRREIMNSQEFEAIAEPPSIVLPSSPSSVVSQKKSASIAMASAASQKKGTRASDEEMKVIKERTKVSYSIIPNAQRQEIMNSQEFEAATEPPSDASPSVAAKLPPAKKQSVIKSPINSTIKKRERQSALKTPQMDTAAAKLPPPPPSATLRASTTISALEDVSKEKAKLASSSVDALSRRPELNSLPENPANNSSSRNQPFDDPQELEELGHGDDKKKSKNVKVAKTSDSGIPGPGAYAVQSSFGAENNNNVYDDNDRDLFYDNEGGDATTITTDFNSTVPPLSVEAHVVQDQDEYALKNKLRAEIMSESVAAQVIASQDDKQSTSNHRNRRRLIFLIVAVILIGIIIFLAVFFTQRRDRDNNNQKSLSNTVVPFEVLSASPTFSPSLSPTTAAFGRRQEAIFGLLESLYIGHGLQFGTLILDQSSPQYLAYDWLITEDTNTTLLVDNLDTDTNSTMTNTTNSTMISFVQERYALAVFYFATNGQQWNQTLNFLTPQLHNCRWFSRRADGNNAGIRCNDKGNVDLFSLPNNKLGGTLPFEIGFLSSLEFIRFNSNADLGGTLPTSIGLLTMLREFHADECRLTGTLPSQFFNLPLLIELFIEVNMLTGTIPPNVGNATRLRALELRINMLTGTLPESISTLSNLRAVDLERNNLRGPLPSFVNNSQLAYLYLEEMSFTGTIPTTMGNLRRLEDIVLIEHRLSGSIPQEFMRLPNLNRVELIGTDVDGEIPGLNGTLPIFENAQRLEVLILFKNSITGTLDEFMLNSPPSMRFIDFDGNDLTGTIPTEVGLLQNLITLDIKRNNFTGTIPTEIGLLSDLSNYIDLNEMNLNGTIPTELGRLSEIIALRIPSNQLTGPIPSELGLCTGLETLILSDNRLTGTVPSSIAFLPILNELIIAQNLLVDDFSETFCSPNRFDGDVSEIFIRADCLSGGNVSCDCCQSCCNGQGEDECEDF